MADVRRYVLVVEDDETLRHVITESLTESGLEVLAAEDGEIALAICREREPAVIVLDLKLPRLDGAAFVEAYRRLRRRESDARIIVVSATTSAAETTARIRAAKYLSKPFNLDELIAAVKGLLEPQTPT